MIFLSRSDKTSLMPLCGHLKLVVAGVSFKFSCCCLSASFTVGLQLGSQGSSIEWRLVVKSTKSLHYLTSDMFCLTNNLSFWIFDTNLPIVPGGVSFYLPRTLQLEKCGQRATSTEKNECKFCCHCYQYFINQLLYYTLLLIIQIVFHGFNDSVDEAGVKIRSTPVTFVLFDDLLNKVSRHVWLVRIVNSF